MSIKDLTSRAAKRARKRREAWFKNLVSELPRPVRILDLGGTNAFWETLGWAGGNIAEVTLLNLVEQPKVHANVSPRVGDATNLAEFEDNSFDLVFSNSVIEHVFTFENQRRMANEVRRLADRYWVQTPNYWFPIEPHFYFVGWQWLPLGVRVAILRRRDCGWRGKTEDYDEALQSVSEVRLITGSELAELFPDAEIRGEKYLGLTKSWIAIGGF